MLDTFISEEKAECDTYLKDREGKQYDDLQLAIASHAFTSGFMAGLKSLERRLALKSD